MKIKMNSLNKYFRKLKKLQRISKSMKLRSKITLLIRIVQIYTVLKWLKILTNSQIDLYNHVLKIIIKDRGLLLQSSKMLRVKIFLLNINSQTKYLLRYQKQIKHQQGVSRKSLNLNNLSLKFTRVHLRKSWLSKDNIVLIAMR